jgi:hypothetical protein
MSEQRRGLAEMGVVEVVKEGVRETEGVEQVVGRAGEAGEAGKVREVGEVGEVREKEVVVVGLEEKEVVVVDVAG